VYGHVVYGKTVLRMIKVGKKFVKSTADNDHKRKLSAKEG
jgi:hypothetical protein